MIYRRFGRTELSMPVISCGGMRYQHKWDDIPWEDVPKAGQENIETILAAALENGINHIETARAYGSSEMQLGHALKQFPRESYILQTKVAPKPTQEEFRNTFETSMAYLQQDTVDLLSLHGLNNRERIDMAMHPGGCLEVALKLKEEGRVKHIGFSTHAATHEIIELIDSGAFEYLNLHWYFTNQLNATAIDAAGRQDMGVFIISPNDKGGQLYKPPQKLVDLCRPLHPMAFNDLFCISNPQVQTLSCGASKPSDFDLHVEAVQNLENAGRMIQPILDRILNEVSQVIGPDWFNNWHKGIPDWQELPESINVKDIVRLWTWAKSVDLVDFGKWRYNQMSADSIWIPGNPVKKFDEDTMLRKLQNSPFADRIIEILHEARSMFGETK